MKAIKKNLRQGFSLAEIVVVVGVIGIVGVALLVFALDSFRFSKRNSQKVDVIIKVQEVMNALIINKSELWSQIIENTDDGPKHLVFQNNKYYIMDGANVDDNFSLSFTIGDVYRDEEGNIVPSGGDLDLNSRVLIITASWKDSLNVDQVIENEIYVTNWSSPQWQQTSIEDFITGTTQDTTVYGAYGGEIELTTVIYPDWCDPSNNQWEYDLPGSAKPTTVTAKADSVFMGTGGNDTGITFMRANVTNYSPRVVTFEDEFDGYLENDHWVDDNYAYLATTHNSKELVIVDISSSPYTEVGYYDAPYWTDARAVAVDGNITYLGQGRQLISINTTNKTGSHTSYDSVNIGNWFAYISKIIIIGDYAYMSLVDDWYELAIADISNPSDLQYIGWAEVNFRQTYDLAMNNDGTRAYFGTDYSWFYDEFFVLDTTDKYGSIPVISSYNTDGQNVRGITYIDEDQKAIIVGNGGEEYQVLDLSDENNVSKCGAMDISTEATDVDYVKINEDYVYTYVLTKDYDGELKIIRGGDEQGAGSPGQVRAPYGTFESGILDAEDPLTKYLTLQWTEDKPETTDLKIQLKIGNEPDLSDSNWFGSDGTSGTYFLDHTGSYIPENRNTGQYVQYKAYFSTTTEIDTPVLESVRIVYEKPN